MWLKKTKEHPNLLYFLLISACLNLLFIPLALWNFGDLKENIFNEEIVASIVTSKEDEEFIRKVCEDLEIESEIAMIVGPYYVHSFLSQTQNYRLNRLLSRYPIVVDPEDPAGRILMKESIYTELTTEERRAVLAHEIWHINAFIKDGEIAALNLNKEIEANRFAVRYVDPDILINLYRRYGGNYPEINALIEDLERQKP